MVVVSKTIIDSIKHVEYVNKLFNGGLMRHSMKRIQSKLHEIETYDVSLVLIIRIIYLMMVLIVWLIYGNVLNQ